MKRFITIFSLLFVVGAGCASSTPVVETEPMTASDTQQDATEENIILEAPEDKSLVTSPLELSGSARAFENIVDWTIVDARGSVLQSGFIEVDAKDVGEFGEFSERIFLEETVFGEVFLEVFTISAKNGEKQDLVGRSLVVEEREKTSVRIFYTDPILPGADGCAEIDFEKRTVLATVNVAELALMELLNGPESDWAVTEIPDGTTLNSIVIEDGLARVDFSSSRPAVWSGSACHVISIRRQIEQTLLQFSSVSDVQISVNGDSHNILIP